MHKSNLRNNPLYLEIIEGQHSEPRLYVDYGADTSEHNAFYLTKTDRDYQWEALLPMPFLIKTIRLDPSSHRGVVRLHELSVRPSDLNLFFGEILSRDDAHEILAKTAR